MDTFEIAPGQLIFRGHNLSRAMAIASAREHLIRTAGLSEFDADTLLVDTPTRVAQAWWGGKVGIVQGTYPEAEPITVVNLPEDERIFTGTHAQRKRGYTPTEIQ